MRAAAAGKAKEVTAHSKIGASSMYRWSKCAGSVRLSEGVPNVSSSYAEEGSQAHELAAQCLKDGVWTSGDDAVDTYIEAVRMEVGEDETLLHIEQSFDLSNVHPGCFGTADAVVWNPALKILTVMDYKHGAGIPVNVRGNPQLRYYALGALLSLNYPASKVKLVIVQPRCEHPDGPVRSETIDALELLDFCADLIRYAKATEDPNAPLVAGDHCQFCPAGKALICPELKNKAQAIAKTVFTPVVGGYDPQELRRFLDMREPVKAFFKMVDEFAYSEAEAGRCPPGYKLVDKQGRRKWKPGVEEEGGYFRDWYEPAALKSPAQIEKMGPDAKKWVGEHSVKESSGHVLVPEDDKRPAIKLLEAKDVFTPTETGETIWQ